MLPDRRFFANFLRLARSAGSQHRSAGYERQLTDGRPFAVLLVLAALRYRAGLPAGDRVLVPVPVMFTLHGWDPRSQPVSDWLAGRLAQTYPALAGRRGTALARALLAAGRLAVILDGLDEMAAELRPAALASLSRQACFRLGS